jgi:hypothetical protein
MLNVKSSRRQNLLCRSQASAQALRSLHVRNDIHYEKNITCKSTRTAYIVGGASKILEHVLLLSWASQEDIDGMTHQMCVL